MSRTNRFIRDMLIYTHRKEGEKNKNKKKIPQADLREKQMQNEQNHTRTKPPELFPPLCRKEGQRKAH